MKKKCKCIEHVKKEAEEAANSAATALLQWVATTQRQRERDRAKRVHWDQTSPWSLLLRCCASAWLFSVSENWLCLFTRWHNSKSLSIAASLWRSSISAVVCVCVRVCLQRFEVYVLILCHAWLMIWLSFSIKTKWNLIYSTKNNLRH